MKIINKISIFLIILFIGLFISQSIYWISLDSKSYTVHEELVNSKDLEGEKLKELAKKYKLHLNVDNECSCQDSKYIQATKVYYTRVRGTFPFYKDIYKKDSLFYPIATK